MRIFHFLTAACWQPLLSRFLAFTGRRPALPHGGGVAVRQDASEPQIAHMLRHLPLPSKGHLLPDRSVFAGPDEGWAGRLVFSMGMDTGQVCRFYLDAMPDLGWCLVGAARGRANAISALSFRRGGRSVAIKVSSDRLDRCSASMILLPCHSPISSNLAAGVVPPGQLRSDSRSTTGWDPGCGRADRLTPG